MFHSRYEASSRAESRAQLLPNGQPIAPLVTEVAMSCVVGMVEIALVRLDVGPVTAGELARCLSEGERLRASRLAFERDRCRFIVGRAQLRQLLASRLGVRPEAVELAYGKHGKPALSRRFAGSELRFNVAHAEDVAVYAFARGLEVGVDIEAVHDLPDADRIATQFFSRSENDSYHALDPRDRALGFFNCWTRKEAFIKAIGDGLRYPLGCFDVSLMPGAPAKILRIEDAPGDGCGWWLESFSPVPGFVAAVVAGNGRGCANSVVSSAYPVCSV